MTDSGEAAWAEAIDTLGRRHRRLLEVVAGLDAARLDAIVPGKDFPVAVMLYGTAQHYAYHAGQIALLKRLVWCWWASPSSGPSGSSRTGPGYRLTPPGRGSSSRSWRTG